MSKYKVADAVIEIQAPEEWIDNAFEQFRCLDEETTDIFWKVEYSDDLNLPQDLEWKDFDGFYMNQHEDSTIIRYAIDRGFLVHAIVYKDNYQKAYVYCVPMHQKTMTQEENLEFAEYLSYFFEEAFFLAILQKGGISIHSSSIIYQEQGVVFSAPSGEGKTTHTGLWTELFHTPVLDGDVTVCRCIEGTNYIYGLPWCGTSGKYQNQRVPLKALVFLKQAKENRAERLNTYDTFQNLFARSFTPLWDSALTIKRIEITQNIIKYLKLVYCFECLPNTDSADLMKKVLDTDWEK